LASGMTGWTGVPPPTPIDFTAAFAIGQGGGSSLAVASSMGTIIDAWFRTGTAIPPAGPTITWS
jgi:hypothetical protein